MQVSIQGNHTLVYNGKTKMSIHYSDANFHIIKCTILYITCINVGPHDDLSPNWVDPQKQNAPWNHRDRKPALHVLEIFVTSPSKAGYTLGNCQGQVSSLCVYANFDKSTKLWQFGFNSPPKLQENNEKKKTPLLQKFICIHQMPEKNFMLEAFLKFKYLGVKITPFSKTTRLERESFLTMFYIPTNIQCIVPNKFLWSGFGHLS